MIEQSQPAQTNLTNSQFLIWMGQKLNPDLPLYNMVLAWTINGTIDPGIFQTAFQALIDRCDALRSIVKEHAGTPSLHVLPELRYQVPFFDLSAEEEPLVIYEAWQEQQVWHRFDMAERLFDSALFKLSDDTFIWYLNQHHLITDGVAVALLYRAMASLYSSATQRDLANVSDLPRYQDYAQFERQHRESSSFESASAYWQDKLSAPLAPTEFYGKAPVPGAAQTRRVVCKLGSERSEKIRSLALKPGFRTLTPDLALFNIFATLLFTYLHRIGTQHQLRIGTPVHSRPTRTFKETVGLFIEICPLQVEIDEGETFMTLADKVAREMQSVLRYAQPGVSSAITNRSYNVLLNYVHASFGDFDGFPTRSEWVHAGSGDSNHHLRVQIHDLDASSAFLLHFDVNSAIFDEGTRERMVGHFLQIVDALLDDPALSLSEVQLLSATEEELLVRAFNRTATQPPPYQNVVEMFEHQVKRTPEAVAIVDGPLRLTYRELNRRANRVARYLRILGVGPDTLVGLCTQRSAETIVGLLGVLKAGGAYVPLDPHYPSERLAFMMEEIQAPVILTQAALEARLPGGAAQIISLDEDWAEIARLEGGDLSPSQPADRLAYVIFTSGSTGKPKGAMIAHSALLNYIHWAVKQYCDGNALTFPLFSSLSFDLTVTSIFVPLVTGGTIVVYREQEGADVTDSPAISRVFQEDRVDIVKLTPAHLALLGEMERVPQRLRKMIVGGEEFKTYLARRVHERFNGNIELYNEYGPTEATVGCMVHRYDPVKDLLPAVPIGTPIDNAEIYVLDRYRQPVPAGVTGEIYIGGIGLARGYLNRPDLTAERFLPATTLPQQRLYKTGDLARWRADGELTFLGRVDHQVKIRGYRIELGEIETNLVGHPEIRESVVVTLEPVTNPAQTVVTQKLSYCTRCGLPSNYPNANFDTDGVCSICRAYDSYQEYVDRYFGDRTELRAIATRMRVARRGKYDCLVLFSGGKDSTYMLYQIVELGLRPLVFTLDNGYLSKQTRANILRVVNHLGVDHVFGSTPHMNAIFVDSLQRFSNVCDGCFKTIYTLSIKLAREEEIGYIVTGLSRGQLFETRLADMYEQRIYDRDEIDSAVLGARKAYHRMDDVVSRCLDVQLFEDERTLDEIHFVDFYRYTNVELDEMYTFLAENAPWLRPEDTGRSTNCLINDVGIYMHQKERGFHNYALPYSWDVRLGHKQRTEILAELDDEIDVSRVQQILNEIGYYRHREQPVFHDKRLAAYYVADEALPGTELRTYLSAKLPDYMIPNVFVHLEQMPLTQNGKVDRRALPDPWEQQSGGPAKFVPARSKNETLLAQIWADIFHLDRVGIHDNFFDLGGDSIISIQIVARAGQVGLHFLARQIFDHQTIAELAAVAEQRPVIVAEQDAISGPVPLTPIQQWFFGQNFEKPDHWNQAVLLETQPDIDATLLAQALSHLPVQHDILRARFARDGDNWRQTILPPGAPFPMERVTLAGLSAGEEQTVLEERTARYQAHLNIVEGPLLQAVLFERGAGKRHLLLIVIHHLLVDGVSWYPLLEDLDTAYSQLRRGQAINLPAKTTSYRQWAELLVARARSDSLHAELDYWLRLGSADNTRLPVDLDIRETDGRESGSNVRAAAATIRKSLSVEQTYALLNEAPSAYRTQINDLLLTALASAVTGWTGSRELLIDVEGHGRQEIADGIKLSRTVGWFTTIAPLRIRLPDSGAPGDQIRAVKEQVRALPNQGIGYALLRYLCPDPTVVQKIKTLPKPEILFNYLGQFDHVSDHLSSFKLGHELIGSYGLQNRRNHLLEISSFVRNGRLQLTFVYNKGTHYRDTIETLATSFIEVLQCLIDHCGGSETTGYTSSDFPLADLDDEQLKRLADLLG